MPTVIGHHDVKDTDHWLASPKREEFFGPLGVHEHPNLCRSDQPDSRRRTHGRARYGCAHGRDGNP